MVESAKEYFEVSDFVTPFIQLGEGGYGYVYKTSNKHTGQTVAIKKFKNVGVSKQIIPIYHKLISQRLRHDNVSDILGILRMEGMEGVVLRFSDCRDMHSMMVQYLKDDRARGIFGLEPDPVYTCDHAISWLFQAASGLYYLHSKGIFHRDLKPANLLMSNGCRDVKVCDFDLCKEIGSETGIHSGNKGTEGYQAPEVVSQINNNGSTIFKYGAKSDVFSFGTTAWFVLSRQIPTTEVPIKSRITFPLTRTDGSPGIFDNCPKSIHRMIIGCWQESPSQRPDLFAIVDFLKKVNSILNQVPPPRIMSKSAENQMRYLSQLDRELDRKSLKDAREVIRLKTRELRGKLEDERKK